MHRNYYLTVLRELRDQQVRYVPREKKIQQSRQAELLYREIEETKLYSYRFVCVGITDFKTELHPDLMLEGKQLKHDLILFIEDLFDAANVTAEEAGERVWTISELSERFNVSEKTITRWKQQGLVSRRFYFGKKKRVGFLQSSIDYFTNHFPNVVERGERFSQLTPEEKNLIIQSARRMADSSTSPTEVAKRIARYTGRSVETIRYTLKTFDERHAEIPLFPNRNSPLNEETRERIFLEYRHGIPIETLSKNYNRTRGSIYRIVGQMRAQRIEGFNLEYIDNPEFHEIAPEREKTVLASLPASKNAHERSARAAPAGNSVNAAVREETPTFVEIVEHASESQSRQGGSELPPYLSGLYRIPLLNMEQEQHLFRKMNYLKFKAAQLRATHDPNHPRTALMARIEKLYDQAIAVKNEIVSANLRLVVSIAKRHVGPYASFFDLVSDGNFSLLRAVDKFDYGRGNRFSTYATWAITRNFARTIPGEKKHRDRFLLGEDEALEKVVDLRSDFHLQEQDQFEREQQVNRLLHELNEREQKIIISRFGIGRSQTPLTLNEVGVEIGITKERVRQIESRALEKLRRVAEDEHLEIPGL